MDYFALGYTIGQFIGFLINIGIVVAWCVLWGFATRREIRKRGFDKDWFWWGFFFSVIAWIVATCKPVNRNRHVGYLTSNSLSPTSGGTSQVNPSVGWECNTCGRFNPLQAGTCACGITISENDATITRFWNLED